jgi:alanyl-tRNA synthetase
MIGGNAGISARDIVAGVAPIIGGRGGGRPDLAQAGGTQPERLDDALKAVVPLTARTLGVPAPR